MVCVQIDFLVNFTYFHPGNEQGSRLWKDRDNIVSYLVTQPKAGIDYLVENYSFGKHTEFWDDHIFTHIISHALADIYKMNLAQAVNLYSQLDHALFTSYIRRDENPDRFRRAFWNVNYFGRLLSHRYRSSKASNGHSSFLDCKENNIAFIFKGPLRLAHAEFFLEFLRASCSFSNIVKVSIILIDEPTSVTKDQGIDLVSVYSLCGFNTAFEKLDAYYQLVQMKRLSHICWVASVQNLTLYMGSQIAPVQSYWSMKYHSIIMDSLNKYAGLGFGGKSFNFDGISWYRGRAFPRLVLPEYEYSDFMKLRSENDIPADCFLVGCFVRTEKLFDEKYWQLIENTLLINDSIYFVLACKDLPAISSQFLSKRVFNERFRHIGWVDTRLCMRMEQEQYYLHPTGKVQTH